MFLTIKFLRLIMASASVLIFSPVNAFDLGNGFRSNMTEEQAVALLKRQFDIVTPISPSQPHQPSYIGTSSSNLGFAAIGFCNARLNSYDSSVSGGFPAFVRLIERQVVESGVGKYTASTVETRVGAWSKIAYVWSLGQDVKTITMSQVGTQSAEVTISYKSPSTCQ